MSKLDDLRMRAEVQDVIGNWVNNLMAQNNVPPHMIEDALVKVLAQVREYTSIEILNAFQDEQGELVKEAEEAIVE